jgi:hypothetical protein
VHDVGHVVVNQLTGHEVKRRENHFQGADEIWCDFDNLEKTRLAFFPQYKKPSKDIAAVGGDVFFLGI